MLYKAISQNSGNYNNDNRSSSIKYLKFISIFVNNRSDYFEKPITVLKIIQINIKNVTDEIDKFVS